MLRNFRGWETLVNKDVGYAPYFSSLLRQRVHKKQATNIVVTGEAGEGKSYLAMDICRILEGLTKSGKDRMKLNQIVYTYKQFLECATKLRMGKIIMFDEPSYAMSKREWYKELQQALVKTIESYRFKVHPLFIPIINKALLDKTVRSYLIQFQIEIRARGKAVVYRIYPSQHTDKIYRYTLCNLEYELFDNDLCNLPSCLDCPKLNEGCMIFRAQYERKKAEHQDERYSQALDMATTHETKQLTFNQIKVIAYANVEIQKEIKENENVNALLLRVILREQEGIIVSKNTAYEIRKAIMRDVDKGENTKFLSPPL